MTKNDAALSRCPFAYLFAGSDSPRNPPAAGGDTENKNPFRFLWPPAGSADTRSPAHSPLGEGPEPPGPAGLPLIGSTLEFNKDALKFLSNLHDRYGDVAAFRLNARSYVSLRHPDDIRNLLVRDFDRFEKGPLFDVLRLIAGNGLLTARREDHKRQRRLVQPAFTDSSLAAYREKIGAVAREFSASLRAGTTIDITEAMDDVALQVVNRTLFGTAAARDSRTLARVVAEFNRFFRPKNLTSLRFWPLWLPSPHRARIKRARSYLKAIVLKMIDAQRRDRASDVTLLSRLVESYLGGDGGPSEKDLDEIIDQVITMLLAGHETVGTTLGWTWYLLANHSDAFARLTEEIETLPESARAGRIDAKSLPYTQAVIKESMRLLPAIWGMARVAKADVVIGPYRVPKGTVVGASQFVTHRDGRFFRDPHRFVPERWLDGWDDGRPEFSYFPFGGGPRQCIGAGMAMAELTTIVATLAKSWRFELVPGQRIRFDPLVTLRPSENIRMRVHKRPARAAAERTAENGVPS